MSEGRPQVNPPRASAEQLRAKLAAEMKAARECSGWGLREWLRRRGVGYSPGHISNLEHGHGRVRRELVVAYDEAFSPAEDKKRLQRLWEELTTAEEVEKREERAAQARAKGLRPGPAAEPSPAAREPNGPPQEAAEVQGEAETTKTEDHEAKGQADAGESAGRRRRRGLVLAGVLAVVVMLVVVTLIAVALSSGKPSQEQFAQKADEICLDTEQPLKAMEGELGRLGRLLEQRDPRAGKVLDRQIGVLEALIRDRMQRFRDLDLPSGEAGQRAKDFVNGTEKAAYAGLAVLKQIGEKVMEGETKAALQQLRNRGDFDQEAIRRDDLADVAGAKECSRIRLGGRWGRS